MFSARSFDSPCLDGSYSSPKPVITSAPLVPCLHSATLASPFNGCDTHGDKKWLSGLLSTVCCSSKPPLPVCPLQCVLSCFRCDHKSPRSNTRTQASSIGALHSTSVRSAFTYPNKTHGATVRTDDGLIRVRVGHHVGYLPLTSCSLQVRLFGAAVSRAIVEVRAGNIVAPLF